MNFPISRDGSSAAKSVADLIDELALPTTGAVVERLASLPALPPLPLVGGAGLGSDSGAWSQLDEAHELMDSCLGAVAAMRRHQNRCAALIAVTVEHLDLVTVTEGGLLALDPWQKGMLLQQTQAELALILGVSEGAASRLMEHAKTLVRDLPATLARMREGVLGWEYAVIIADECQLLRAAGVDQAIIDLFEQALLDKAEDSKLPSFREKARRLRERQHPDTIPARTHRAFKDRRLALSRSADGMSWLSLYGPAPAMEAIWDRCTLAGQAAQGPHETRTLTQLRADIASILLLGQTMKENHIHSPATPTPDGSQSHDHADGMDSYSDGQYGQGSQDSQGSQRSQGWRSNQGSQYGRGQCGDGCGSAGLDPGEGTTELAEGQIPAFEDPDYASPAFQEPPPTDDEAHWLDGLTITLSPAPGLDTVEPFPPLPKVMPVVLIPLLGLLGYTSEPAWMEGAGPISMDIAKRMAEKSPSIYRLLVDPVTNKPLNTGAEQYRMTKSMRAMLRIRDEFCQFPGCLAKAATSDVDHLKAFSTSGKTTPGNLEHLCPRHHHMKHFKDDKNRYGQPRGINEPERRQLRLRGWTPHRDPDNRISWTTPTGHHCPPQNPSMPNHPRTPPGSNST